MNIIIVTGCVAKGTQKIFLCGELIHQSKWFFGEKQTYMFLQHFDVGFIVLISDIIDF
jgi:hypothetical protein